MVQQKKEKNMDKKPKKDRNRRRNRRRNKSKSARFESVRILFLVRRRVFVNVVSNLFFFSQKKSDWTMKNKKRVSHPTKSQSLLDFPTLEESKLISPLVKKMSRNDWRQRMCIFLFRIHLTSLQYKAKIHTTKPQRPRQRCVNRKD